MKYFSTILFTLLFALCSFAALAADGAVELPAQSVFDSILKFLEGAAGQSTVAAVILEFVLRLVPSKKPLGILQVAAKLAIAVGDILVKAGKLLDKVLPQKVTEAEKVFNKHIV